MNDIGTRDTNDVDTRDRWNEQLVEPTPGKVPGQRPNGRRRWGGRLFALVGLLLLGAGLTLGTTRYYSQQQQVMAFAKQERDFVPRVRVGTVRASPGTLSVALPATTAAFTASEIYARATGFIVKRDVDIGDRVKAGGLLVQLAVPELDDQISQNEAMLVQLKAALQQAQANQRLAEVTWDRDRPLVGESWATRQQGTIDVQTLRADEAAVGVAQANVSAQENLVKMLKQERDYARVVAPFDGVITQRNVDVGSLVQGNINSGTFMFEMMDDNVIRVFVYVPQDAAFGVAPGVDAIVRVPEMPDREFRGKVTRTSVSLQSGTRTLLTEVDLPNRDHALAPGVYCTVELRIPRKTPSLIVPAEAIIFDRNGLQVAVVENGRAEIRKVTVTRDLGTEVEVDHGVEAGDQVILQPPVNLAAGNKVQVASRG